MMNAWKFAKLQKKYTQIWRAVKYSSQNLTRVLKVHLKSDAL